MGPSNYSCCWKYAAPIFAIALDAIYPVPDFVGSVFLPVFNMNDGYIRDNQTISIKIPPKYTVSINLF